MLKDLFGRRREHDAKLYQPRMPDVDVSERIEEIFADARRAARGEAELPGTSPGQRHLIVVTPGRMLMHQPCPPPGSMSADRVAPIEKLMPSAFKRAVAVIAYTELEAVKTDLDKAIPFAGLLLGFAYLGHAVWVFEGHPSALQAGCREADLLLVDGGMVPFLTEGWRATAAQVMRRKEIYVHDRATYRLSRIGVK